MGSYRPRVFFVSDTHFGHRKMVAMENGERIRPFATVEEHDEEIVRRWNETVDPRDVVYHLGDVVINRRALQTCARLNGRKKLVMGNHDNFRVDEYMQYFESLHGAVQFSKCILSHVPVHTNQLKRFVANIHGHLHKGFVRKDDGTADARYYCVSLEHTDYRPVQACEVLNLLESGVW